MAKPKDLIKALITKLKSTDHKKAANMVKAAEQIAADTGPEILNIAKSLAKESMPADATADMIQEKKTDYALAILIGLASSEGGNGS